MRELCKNGDGLLWAGDSAQAIFAGNAFTFNTLKAFLYRVEVRHFADSFHHGVLNDIDHH